MCPVYCFPRESYTNLLLHTCRNCDVPYGDDCFTVIVDGFIVSDNVKPTYAEVLDTQFKYSDHNPGIMKFKLA